MKYFGNRSDGSTKSPASVDGGRATRRVDGNEKTSPSCKKDVYLLILSEEVEEEYQKKHIISIGRRHLILMPCFGKLQIDLFMTRLLL